MLAIGGNIDSHERTEQLTSNTVQLCPGVTR